MNLFLGPGNRLILPSAPWVEHPADNCPQCKRGDSKKWPHGFFSRLEVPFGWWYTREPHDCLIREATLEELNGAIATETFDRLSRN